MKHVNPVILAGAAILSALATAIASANGMFKTYAWLVPWLYGGSIFLLLLAGVIALVNSMREQRERREQGDTPPPPPPPVEVHQENKQIVSQNLDFTPGTPPSVAATTAMPKSGERKIVDVTPEYLIGLFNQGYTSIQAGKLAEAFMGKWMEVSGPLGDVMGSLQRQVIFADRSIYKQNQVFLYFHAQEWFDQLSTLKPGDKITVRGQIMNVNKVQMDLDNCEIVDS